MSVNPTAGHTDGPGGSAKGESKVCTCSDVVSVMASSLPARGPPVVD